MKFEVRTNRNHPRKLQREAWAKTFSVGVGPVRKSRDLYRRSPAAWYRVTGNSADWREVDALAERLRKWLELATESGDRSPCEVPCTSDRSARIVRAPAGKTAGFYGPNGPGRGE